MLEGRFQDACVRSSESKDVRMIDLEARFQNSDRVVSTPAIDAFAASALQFSSAYAQVALCCPSRGSFLSGRRPASNRLWNVGEMNWRHSAEGAPYDELVSLPQAFKQVRATLL